jgi:hypothetical protein
LLLNFRVWQASEAWEVGNVVRGCGTEFANEVIGEMVKRREPSGGMPWVERPEAYEVEVGGEAGGAQVHNDEEEE